MTYVSKKLFLNGIETERTFEFCPFETHIHIFEFTVTVKQNNEDSLSTLELETIVLPEEWDLSHIAQELFNELKNIGAVKIQGFITDCPEITVEVNDEICSSDNTSNSFVWFWIPSIEWTKLYKI